MGALGLLDPLYNCAMHIKIFEENQIELSRLLYSIHRLDLSGPLARFSEHVTVGEISVCHAQRNTKLTAR